MGVNFKEELNNYSEIINNALEEYLNREDCIEKVLNESKEYSLMAGGKRIRPVLILATYKLFRDDIEKCIPYAVAMEMVHTFSLIHDDLPGIDNDDFRRGKLTNHKKFNEATAILAGDSLLNDSYRIISNEMLNGENIEKKVKIINEFSNAINRMLIGEYVDTEYENKQISNEYLQYIHDNKTGALIKASVRIGAILAGANEEDIDKLTNYADNIGLAFQVKDDILSEIGDASILGKPVGNDKEKGKCTYITAYGLEESINILENITKEALETLENYGEKGEFLKSLAIYIKDRNK